MNFNKENLDFTKSPYTGLSRESWIEAGEYILQGVLSQVKSLNDPITVPRTETKITYPHNENDPLEKMSERFEGLARSFFIAAQLIHDNPETEINTIPLTAYYKHQILRSCTRGDSLCVGYFDELLAVSGEENIYRTFQQTVESAALVIGLYFSKEEIWDTYTQDEKDVIAEFIRGYAYGNTISNNWQLFNMLDLAFLDLAGYSIDKQLMHQYGEAILDFYAGDGWYRDGHAFDYYSCWGFNLYAPLWNDWYGYKNEPDLANAFEEHSNTLMKSFPNLFDKDSFVTMWGRSMIYRNAVTSSFFGNLLLKHPTAQPGLARKISSGALKQFISREDTFIHGIPTLGFYGQFTPLIQGYSCAASPLWIGKAFLCLAFPENHPFWSDIETNGVWDELHPDEIQTTTLNGPALCITNHQKNGETILRTGKVLRNYKINDDLWNYARLSFNSKFPWEATVNQHVEAQQYVLADASNHKTERGNFILWSGLRNSVLYRRLFFNFGTPTELTWLNKIDLADFAVPSGLIRVDKMHLLHHPQEITLGSFGFPDNQTTVQRLHLGHAEAIILKGYDNQKHPHQLAMTIFDGWDSLELVKSKNTNPDSENSILVYGKRAASNKNNYLLSQILTREDHDDFSEDELFPIKQIQYQTSTDSDVRLSFKNGKVQDINFQQIEGALTF